MKPKHSDTPHLHVLQNRLESVGGREYWRSLEELADTEEFRAFVEDEFPGRSPEWLNPPNRREVLRLMAASFGLAGLAACTKMPIQKIIPYVRQPEEVIPGKAMFYATAMPVGGYATGLLVESHLGRPTKVEGNPDHPASLGATDAIAQASVLGLYDPDRAQAISLYARLSAYVNFLAVMNRVREQQHQKKGAGLRILTETVTSPTLAWQIGNILTEFPEAKWDQYEAVHYSGSEIYHFDKADVVVSLDADFLGGMPGSLRYARDFASKRKLSEGQTSMNRLYVAEPSPSITGSTADHRLRMRPTEIETLARSLAGRLGAGQAPAGTASAQVEAIAKDLENHRGSSVVIAGLQQPPAVHALARAMNQALGNVGVTVTGIQPVEAKPVDQIQSLWTLVKEMNAGQVDVLMILGGNPVFTAPADLNFSTAMGKVNLRIHNSLYFDETSELCHWQVPEAHYLESWSDARAFDGTVTILQPLIEPLYGGKTPHEVLVSLTDQPDQTSHEIVRSYWQTKHTGADFEIFWEKALHDGIVPNTASPVVAAGPLPAVPAAGRAPDAGTLELNLRPDPYLFDGRFANNGWLQELPKPESKLTWDNVVYISAATAVRLGVENEDMVDLEYRGGKLRAPIWVLPGQADDCLTMYFGNGRRRGGNVAKDAGFNAYLLRASDQPWGAPGVQLRKTGNRYTIANTQHHHSMEGRGIVKSATLAEYEKDRDFVKHEDPETPKSQSLYPEYPYNGYKWGMTIDQNVCTGCSACVVACQAENNIAVVGKEQVVKHREMQWLRIDRYHKGDAANPEVFNQPMLCQHCEKAPCELVCPVAATVHSGEGLNQMVYNRCVGTRYCSNNCPYKVRRFNFLLYSDWYTESLYGMRNPDVTVRSRGVMEKCTYCVQRINEAKIDSEKEDRRLHDGEIVTACQAACPTRAIVFGDINDTTSQVAKLKQQPLNYGVLGDLNTQPRTTYLARVTNPNPDWVKT